MPESYPALWQQIKQQMLKNRLPQALLFVAPRHMDLLASTTYLISMLICEREHAPCGDCRACHLLKESVYPDVSYLQQETEGSAIKIDQIRGLQQDIYQTPQLGSRRFIVIYPADKMNMAAANALLKILEEPPSHTIFILLAEHTRSLPATVMSRCQIYKFASPTLSQDKKGLSYLSLGTLYSEGSSRAQLFMHSPQIIEALCDLIQEKASPCFLAEQWAGYEMNDLLWLLYLIAAEAIQCHLLRMTQVLNESMIRLARLLPTIKWFAQLERINAIMKKINHNQNRNATLVLEDLLISYLG